MSSTLQSTVISDRTSYGVVTSMDGIDIGNKVGVPAQPSAPPMWEVFADAPPSYEELQELCRSARTGQAGQRAKLRGYVDSLRHSVFLNAARAREAGAPPEGSGSVDEQVRQQLEQLFEMLDRGIDEMSSTDGGEYGIWRNYRLYGEKLRFILEVRRYDAMYTLYMNRAGVCDASVCVGQAAGDHDG